MGDRSISCPIKCEPCFACEVFSYALEKLPDAAWSVYDCLTETVPWALGVAWHYVCEAAIFVAMHATNLFWYLISFVYSFETPKKTEPVSAPAKPAEPAVVVADKAVASPVAPKPAEAAPASPAVVVPVASPAPLTKVAAAPLSASKPGAQAAAPAPASTGTSILGYLASWIPGMGGTAPAAAPVGKPTSTLEGDVVVVATNHTGSTGSAAAINSDAKPAVV